MAVVPASIRHNNPGALWPGTSSRKFGAVGAETLKDGQSNQIATFPDKVAGGAALFDLLYNNYTGMSLRAAIAKWSGGNSVESYLSVLTADGLIGPADTLTKEFVENPRTAIAFAKAMAQHEAGVPYPMTDEEWKQAHEMVFKIPAADGDSALDTPWVDAAIAALGRKEFPGAASNNPDIIRDFALCGRADVTTDETPWCAAFAGARLRECEINIPLPGDALLARKYLGIGSSVSASSVRRGDLRIEGRTNDPSLGHIEIVVDVDQKKGTCRTIAGNVNNSVAYATKPLKGALGYRRVTPGPKPVVKVLRSSPFKAIGAAAGAVAAALTGAADWAANNILWVVGAMPDAVDKAQRSVGATQQVAGWLNMSIGQNIAVAMVASALAFAMYEIWQRERAK